MNRTEQRNLPVDCAKSLAISFVLLIHASADVLRGGAVGSGYWLEGLFWNSLSCGAVLLFLLCSGALFLDPDRSVTAQHIWRRNIPHLLLALAFWALAYQFVPYVTRGLPRADELRESLLTLLRGGQKAGRLPAAGVRFVRTLSRASFGIYLVHLFVLRLLCRCGLSAGLCRQIVSIPLLAALCGCGRPGGGVEQLAGGRGRRGLRRPRQNGRHGLPAPLCERNPILPGHPGERPRLRRLLPRRKGHALQLPEAERDHRSAQLAEQLRPRAADPR